MKQTLRTAWVRRMTVMWCDGGEDDKDDTCCHHIYTSIFVLFMKKCQLSLQKLTFLWY